MSVIGNSPGVASQRVVSPFTATAGQTTFTPISGYTIGYCDVFLNGIKLANGDDYTAADGVSVVLSVGAAVGDFVEVVAYFPRGLSDGYLKAEADARFPRVDVNTQGLTTTQKTNARTNIGAQADLGYTPINKAGDTVTGVVLSTYDFQNGVPAQKWTTTLNTAFMHPTQSLAPNMTAGNTIAHFIGKAANAYNMSSFGFKHSSDGSVDNVGTIGLWNKDHIIQWDGRGAVTKQFQPFFVVRTNAGSTVTSGKIPWNIVDKDTQSSFDTTNYQYDAPVAGVYLFTANVYRYTTSADSEIALAINGSVYDISRATSAGAAGYTTMSISTIVYLAQHDKVSITVLGGTAHANASNMHFNGILLG